MSYDWNDAAADDYYSDVAAEEAYEEMRKQVVEEFKGDLLSAYYLAHPTMPHRPLALLNEAKRLRGISDAASLALACSCIELTIKELILRPVVHGVIHQESVADLVADLTLGHAATERFRGLLFGIIGEFAGLDLKTYARPGARVTLWEEVRNVQNSRNRTLHRGETASPEDAIQAVAVAEHLLCCLFHQAIGRFGFVVDAAGTIQAPPSAASVVPRT